MAWRWLICDGTGAMSEKVDLFFNPALELARKKAAAVEPGMMARTTLSANDAAELLGVEGASFIIRLPRSAPGNIRPYLGQQWYVNGEPTTAAVPYELEYVDIFICRAFCWLVDIVVIRDCFSKDVTRVVHAVRVQPLDDEWGGVRMRGPIQYPEKAILGPEPHFEFFAGFDQRVSEGADIPLACWFQFAGNDKLSPDVLQLAKNAPLACVFYLRLQKEQPGK